MTLRPMAILAAVLLRLAIGDVLARRHVLPRHTTADRHLAGGEGSRQLSTPAEADYAGSAFSFGLGATAQRAAAERHLLGPRRRLGRGAAYGYTRARCHSSLEYAACTGILHIKENGRGE
jgi:hypothetical protein